MYSNISLRLYGTNLPILLLNWLNLINFYMIEKEIPVLKNEFSWDQSGINLVLFYPNLTYNENECNKATEKDHLGILPLHKRTLVNVNKTINFYDLEYFGSKKTIVILKDLCKFQVNTPINAKVTAVQSFENLHTFISWQPCC